MDKQIVLLIEEYIIEVLGALEVMLYDLNVFNKSALIEKRQEIHSTISFIKTKRSYIFHGRGCRVENRYGDIIIDWDFGPNEVWVGINFYLFINYIENRYNKEFIIRDRVRSVFAELNQSGAFKIIAGLNIPNYKNSAWNKEVIDAFNHFHDTLAKEQT